MRSPSDRRHVSRAAAALLLLALAACFERGGNPFTPGAGGVGEAVFGAEALEWFTPDSIGGWTMVPLVDGSRVYFERDLVTAGGVVTRSAELVALDRATGDEAWSSPIITAENAVAAGGRIGAVWGSLPIFDPASGTRLHTYRFGETPLSGNVASDGARFYAATHDGHAVAVDPATATAVWETNLAGGSGTAAFGVAVAGEAVAVTLKHFAAGPADRDSGMVAVLERGTGAVRWRARITGSDDPGIVETPVIVAGMVIVVTQGHDVRAYNLQTGALVWGYDASMVVPVREVASRGLAACEDFVIVPTGDMGLVSLSATTGAWRWRLGDIGGGSLLGVRCENGRVLALGGGLRVFNAYTGARLAVYPRREPPSDGREFLITGAVSDGHFLYVATTYGYAKVDVP